MPIIDGDFEALTEEEIEELLADALRDELGEDIDLSDSSVWRSIVSVIAAASSEQVSQTLEDTFKGAFLETAEGIALDRVVEILGIARNAARRATGVVTFERTEPSHQTFTIPTGTVVQTDSQNPVRFETTDSTNIQLYADFENNTLSSYSGTLSGFSITNNASYVYDGDFALEYDSTSAGDTIWRESTSRLTHRGKRLSIRVRAEAGAQPRQLFGTINDTNTYYTELDTSAGTSSEAAHKIVVRDGGVDTTLKSEIIPYTSGDYVENEIDWRLEDQIVSIIRDDAGNEISTISATGDDTFLQGGMGFENGSSVRCHWDEYTSYSTSVNIREMDGGTQGNVGSNTLIVLPTVPSGVEDVFNPHPAGDSRFVDIEGDTYIVGRERESDDELRERTRNTVGQAGSATIDSIASNIRNVEGVESVKVFENKEDTTDIDGRPAHSFEPVVLGGNEQDILEAIYDKKAATAHDTGGHVGTLVDGTVTSEITEQQYTISFSRPSGVNVEFTADIVVDDTYIGNEALRNKVVEYVGGTRSDGTTVVGLVTGEDVKIDQLRDAIVNDSTGVVGISSLSVTPATTTDANGLEIISVGDNEVATADASNASLVLNVTVQ